MASSESQLRRGLLADRPLSELEVWEAFRALRLEGRGLFPSMTAHLFSTKAFDRPGRTLEIGAGDAELWSQGGSALFEAALCAGPLVLTDADPKLVAKLKELPLLQRPGVGVERADVMSLQLLRGQFARVVATHVLHWCGTASRVEHAVAELAGALVPGGAAFIVTVDERVHMVELYDLLRSAHAALTQRGIACVAMPQASPRVLPFCASNAPGLLETAFARADRFDWSYNHVVEPTHAGLGVRGEKFLVSYVRTLPFIRAAISAGELPEVFFHELEGLIVEKLRVDGVFRISRCDVLYECRAT